MAADGDAGFGISQIKEWVESGFQIRLASGIIGKSSLMWFYVLLIGAIGMARISPTTPVFDGLVVLILGYLVESVKGETRKMRAWAEKNPGLALLEGAQLLQWQKNEAQRKGQRGGDTSKSVAAPDSRAMVVTDPEDVQR